MFKIIGADGREYGPVNSEQLREWIRQGRANANTRVLMEGTSDWKKLSEFQEFTGDLGMTQAASELTGTAAPGDATALTNDILASGYHLDIGRCYSRAWKLVMDNFWLTVGASFVIFAMAWFAGTLFVASLLINYVLWGGLDWMFLKLVRGQRADFADIFSGFSAMFVPLMLFSLVAQSLFLVGLVLCVLPGLYAATVWLLFGALVIMDKRLDFWPAMELSRKVVQLHFWKVLWFMIVGILVLLLGLLLFVVGLFVALPIVVAAGVYAYEDIFGARRVSLQPGPLIPAPDPISLPTQPAP